MSQWDRYVLRPWVWTETSRSETVPHIGPYVHHGYFISTASYLNGYSVIIQPCLWLGITPIFFYPLRYSELRRNRSRSDSLTETYRARGYWMMSLILPIHSSTIYSVLHQMASGIIF